ITANTEFEEKAEMINKIFSSSIRKYPSGFTQFLIALDFATGPSKEIIISGEDHNSFHSIILEKFIPSKVVLKISSIADPILKLAPYLKNYMPVDNKTEFFICENYICNLPVDNSESLKNLLK
ncbi:MAG TPA: hypothetical protein VLN45_09220, partial [Ignavibacteriaceae bacterium]|nr:hypothetical protein [Ignavibacteriaceae bacterium]